MLRSKAHEGSALPSWLRSGASGVEKRLDASDESMTQSEASMAVIDRGPPRLLVVVDTEEEFDWSKPFSRAQVGVSHVKHLGRVQNIFERFGLRPTYLVDYPVASQDQAFRPLREWLADGRCDIGAHLHPWVNPPFEEEVSVQNSYPGNLPAALEREKLAQLTATIEENFAYRPTIYRAGRYGIGPATGAILEELGYTIDTSVVPRTDFSEDAGPDFRAYPSEPFWFGPLQRVLEIPLTVGWYGALSRYQGRVQPLVKSSLGRRLHVAGIFARLRLLERIRLSPEGIVFAELKRLTETLIRRGTRVFGFTFHSPSVVPGRTPYVRSEAELQQFLDVIERYCAYFFGECGGVASSLREVRALLLESRPTVKTGSTGTLSCWSYGFASTNYGASPGGSMANRTSAMAAPLRLESWLSGLREVAQWEG